MAYFTYNYTSRADLKTFVLNTLSSNGFSVSGDVISVPGPDGTGIAGTITLSTHASQQYRFLTLTGQPYGGAVFSDISIGCLANSLPSDVTNEIGTCHLFIHHNPAEVTIIVNYETIYYSSGGFGVSDIPNIPINETLWVQASVQSGKTYSWNRACIELSATSSPYFRGSYNTLPFLGQFISGNLLMPYTGLTGAMLQAALQPNTIGGDALLCPIYIHNYINTNFSLYTVPKSIMFLRINNYNPLDIIACGNDEWVVFPAFNKTVDHSNNVCSVSGTITGTYGFAVKK